MGRFDYVENLKEDAKKKQKNKITVSLSVAAKTKKRQSNLIKLREAEKKMDVVEEKESEFNLLCNPSRVTPNQIKYVQWIDKRYKPLTLRLSGFVMVEDTKPELDEEFVEQKEIGSGGVYGDEPDPPKPFKYLGN